MYTTYYIRDWNNTAKDCYKIGCVCQDCPIYELYFENSNKKCQMKYVVREMVRRFGIPDDLKRKRIVEGE